MKRKVCIAMPVLLVGGTEIQTLNLAKALLKADCAVTVVCAYEFDRMMVDRFEKAGASVLLMNYQRASGLLHLLTGLVKVFREATPEIVHVQYVAPGFIHVLAARISGIRTVFATVHQPATPYGWKEKLLLRTAALMCTAFFCVSEEVEMSWFGDGRLFSPGNLKPGRKHYTIYNAVDVEKAAESAASADPAAQKRELGAEGCKTVGIVGRLRSEKGHAVLLEAMKTVLKSHPDTVLIVVGDGPDMGMLKKKAASLGIDSGIRWLGMKTREEVCALYSAMDVVAAPSLFEGFGLAAAEAMAAGVPVVASDTGGLREVVGDGGAGLLVPPGDAKALADALSRLIGDGNMARKMGAEAKKRVLSAYSMERFNELIDAAYSLLGGE